MSIKNGYLCIINTVLLFSTYEVVSKTLVGKIDPFQVNFIRFLLGGLILILFLLYKRDLKIEKKELLVIALVGFINVVVSMNLLQLSLYMKGAQASLCAVIFSSNPIFVSIFAYFLDKERFNPVKVAGLIFGILGIVIVFYDKLNIDSIDIRSPIFALLSAVFYGLYTVLGRKQAVKIGSLKMNSYSFIAGSLLLLPVMLVIKGTSVFEFQYSAALQVMYLAVFVTGIAYLTYFKGLSVLGAGKGSMVFFIKPVLASVIAVVFLKEKPSIYLAAGTLLILASIILVLNSEKITGRYLRHE
ncbi:MAG TPA: DMT family transporter [Pseudobacteroides sp.]|uniref:DMT family transporter n=1 Tax=Pseudobacteroides sp. TaxID=1968840 RepID=UPI002F91EBE2